MARKGGKDRGIVFKKGSWWVRLVHHGREKGAVAQVRHQEPTQNALWSAEIRYP